eukprot:tig00020934_g16125.t1
MRIKVLKLSLACTSLFLGRLTTGGSLAGCASSFLDVQARSFTSAAAPGRNRTQRHSEAMENRTQEHERHRGGETAPDGRKPRFEQPGPIQRQAWRSGPSIAWIAFEERLSAAGGGKQARASHMLPEHAERAQAERWSERSELAGRKVWANVGGG